MNAGRRTSKDLILGQIKKREVKRQMLKTPKPEFKTEMANISK